MTRPNTSSLKNHSSCRHFVNVRRVLALRSALSSSGDINRLAIGAMPLLAGANAAAVNADAVLGVPVDASGWPCYPTQSIAGHVSAGEGTNNLLYYWLTPAFDGALSADTPLVIWLNGGPGASSLAGLFWENGPFTQDANGNVLPSTYPWCLSVHMLYWDNPVGTGYSYNTQGSSDCYVGNERDMAAQFVNALQAFYQRHPEYASNPLYLAGESYAGKYLPYIALEITYRNLFASNGVIPLRGMAIGDGWMIPARQCEDQVRYAALLGILDTNQVNKVQQICDRIERCLTQGDYVSAKKLDDELMAKLSACGGGMDLYDVRQFGDIEVAPLSAYLNSAAVKKCFNVPSNVNWQCSDESGPVSDALVEDIMQSVAELVPLLVDYPKTAAQIVAWHDQDEVRPTRLAATSAAKYKLLFYTGTFDLSCGFSGSEQLLRSMSWSGQQLWSGLSRGVWYAENGSGNKVTQGYIKQADNLTQIEIPDAGHMIPLSQPAINRDMIYRWIEDSGFPSYDPLAES